MTRKPSLTTATDEWTPDRITNLRARLGLTLGGLASRCGVHMGTVQKWILPETSSSRSAPSGSVRVILDQLEREARWKNPDGIELISPGRPRPLIAAQHRADFARRLSGLIESRGLSQQTVADATGVHFTLVSKWVNGARSPNRPQCEALADLFGTTVNELLGTAGTCKQCS